LGDFPEPQAVAALGEALKDEDARVRYFAIGALGKIGGQAGPALPALFALYDKEEDEPRKGRIRQMCQQIVPTAKEASAELVKAIKDGSDPVRLLALELLGSFDDPKEGATILTSLLEAKTSALRVRAAIALHEAGQNTPAVAKVLVE